MRYLLLLFVLSAGAMLIAATISGYIYSSDDGELISYANAVISSIERGSQTNSDGIFTITGLEAGDYKMKVSCMGYKSQELEIVIADNLDDKYIQIGLIREAIEMEGSGVTGAIVKKSLEFEQNDEGSISGKLELKGEMIAELPQSADADVLKALQILPGVSTLNEQSSGLYVRGGTPDQNQILLDGADVYNPSHLGGIFSTFNTDAIASVKLYKAGFPANYGDRLSSVLDIRNKDGNRERYEGVLRLSMMSASGTFELPWSLLGEKGSIMASYRRTLYDVFDFDMPDMGFYDGHFKINWDAGIYDKLSVSTYFGEDDYHTNDGEKIDMVWGNNTYTLQWRHVFNSRLYTVSNLSYSLFHFDMEQSFGSGRQVVQENRINDVTLRSNFHYQPNASHELEFGIEGKDLGITFGVETDLDINNTHYPWLEVPSMLGSVYIQDSWDIGKSWMLQPGLRLTGCHAESKYHPDQGEEDFFRVSPRFAIRKKLNESLVYFNYGRYYQYLTSTNRNDWPMTLWMPIDKSVEPGEADHYVIGWQGKIAGDSSIQIEAYYKDLRNQVAFDEEAFMEWTSEQYLSAAYNLGDGYCWGGELLLGTNWHGINGFLSYSYSQNKILVEDLNLNPLSGEAEYYFPTQDRTHNLKLIENYNLTEETGRFLFGSEVKLGMVYTYATGQPQQKPEGIYEDSYGIQFIDGYLDNARLPAYHRFDISFRMKWQMDDYSVEPYIQVVNLLDRENVWTRSWYADADEEEVLLKYQDTSMFGIMPFAGINVKW